MRKYVGADVTSMVTLPVLIFEPMTMIQKMAEVCVLIEILYALFNLLPVPNVTRTFPSNFVAVDGIFPSVRYGR